MRDLPIGFLDSGFGGLTVVKESLKQLPNESIIYIGDSARAPYGSRPLSEVRQYTKQLTAFLMEKGIKMLVIACNTGTAATLKELRREMPIPVVGVIHAGSRAAIKVTENQQIGVIGTKGTVESHLYQKVIDAKENNMTVHERAVPRFVPIVEEQRINDAETMHIINEDLQPLKENNVDTLVLGCTHYPLLRNQIQRVMGEHVILIDSGAEAINEVSTLLDYFNLGRSSDDNQKNSATQAYYTTGDGEDFAHFTRQWLNQPDLTVQEVVIRGDEIIDYSNEK
ncbi:glutamate racemase [Aerococcaceae bacterium DSM 111020]|nr:glutamate racemase [Aerococcaceae bacterium DSM 111020]